MVDPRILTSDTDFRLLASRTGAEWISSVVSHRVCGDVLAQPRGTNTDGTRQACSTAGRVWLGRKAEGSQLHRERGW